MWAHMGLPMGLTPNVESRVQAIMEEYPWGYFQFWLIFRVCQNPTFWDPNFSPPCDRLAAPYLFVHENPGPNFTFYPKI